DRGRDTDLDREIDLAHIDPELERGRRDEGAELARLETFLRIEPAFPSKAAVVARDLVLTQYAREPSRDPFRELSRVDEDERRAMRLDEVGDSLEDFLPGLARTHGGERRFGDLERQIERASVSHVHQFAAPSRANEEIRDIFDRFLCCG